MKTPFHSILAAIRFWPLLPFLFAFQSDVPVSRFTIPFRVYSVTSGDLDQDGDADIVTGHIFSSLTNWGGLTIMNNNGNGSFNLEDSLYFYGWQFVICRQLDPVPNPELIFKKETTNSEFIGVIYNNTCSDSLFLNTNKYDGVEFMTTGDIDHNGFADILFVSNNKLYWGVFYNYGYHNFSQPEYHSVTGYYPYAIACGDLNGDTRDDIVIGGQSVEVWYSLPGGFQREVLEINTSREMIAVADFDADGDNDLVTASGFCSLALYRNQGDTILQALPEVIYPTSSTDFSVTDFNNDSLPDIAFLTIVPDTSGTGITDTIGGINILYNLGNFQLSPAHFVKLENYDEGLRQFTCADFDGNGYTDIAVTRNLYVPMTGNLEILFNDGNGNFLGNPVGIDCQSGKSPVSPLACMPNPFYGTTHIRYTMENPAAVTITINNSSGKLISRINEGFKIRGTYYVNFANSVLSAGTYYYSLLLNGKMHASGKMIKL
jgi:hypothetical protein